ncbi:WRKY transcription factor 53 [Pyrus ussuriensis x Pyrus communis]|uniref:WRKY transcription factor 53 n=1 Tax=Pyrus ussuriensis x Pyrus communis TaxID=2448454 RepID=A0A5N5GZM8_9ROSA|nr:WRKY transcription factor 53 [Pyrus ussuriensis x Pyrus communis]
MDSSKSSDHKSLVNEIIEGLELAKQLRLSLNAKSSSDKKQFLVQRILSSYEKALLMLKCSVSPQSPIGAITSVPESQMSAGAGPCCDDNNTSLQDRHDLTEVSKKRKEMAKWTEHVTRVSCENGIEGAHEDGHCWRKYGQKDILGTKHPRSYYRCTYRNLESCWATKQVQRSDEDPTVFEITYKGKHTCSHGRSSVPPPPSPEKQEQKRHNHNDTYQQQQSQGNQISFPTNLRVNTENLDDRENMASPFSFTSTSFGCMNNDDAFHSLMLDDNSLLDNFNQSLLSPAAGGSNNYFEPASQMRNIAGKEQRSESDLAEIISAKKSSTNSSIPDIDFSLEPVELGSYFPFDCPGFFL